MASRSGGRCPIHTRAAVVVKCPEVLEMGKFFEN